MITKEKMKNLTEGMIGIKYWLDAQDKIHENLVERIKEIEERLIHLEGITNATRHNHFINML